ncbi:MAG: matrixin family metalloprotease [Phycisphaerae bacterium]|nr:matrixin family metalloprotease [Phycisphaerae bacterium]
MRCRHTILAIVGLCLGMISAGCIPADPETPDDDIPGLDVAPTAEVEPNNSLATANVIAFDDTGRARIVAELPGLQIPMDVDYFDLGPMTAGDRLTVQITTPGSERQMVIGVFDGEGNLFRLALSTTRDDGKIVGPFFTEAIRHDSDHYYLAATLPTALGMPGAAYQALVTVQRGGPAPEPQPQVVYLNFEGGEVEVPEVGQLVLGPFDPAGIDPAYAGQTALVREHVVQTARQNYARYNVTVLSSDEGPPPAGTAHSTVYFGGYDPWSLGMALQGTDFYNANPSDDAIVFTERFTDDLFTTRPTAEQLGVALGNVAAHEVGHLLGLSHVVTAADLMNAYTAPDYLLTDQHFRNSLLTVRLFPAMNIALGQNAPLLLAETVGLVPVASHTEVQVGNAPTTLAMEDLDGDGVADMVVGCPVAQELWLRWNDGTGQFPIVATANSIGVYFVLASDLNGDGFADIHGLDLAWNSVFVFLADGQGSFNMPDYYEVGQTPLAHTPADLDGDGHMDLAVANAGDDTISILMNLGDGTFGPHEVVAEASFAMSIVAGDLDGDSDLDLAFGNVGGQAEDGGVTVLLNQGNAAFAPATNWSGDLLARDLALADMDGDGRLDLAAVERSAGSVFVLFNDGSGGFGERASYPTGPLSEGVAAADLDGDGHIDLVVANGESDDVSVLFNRGDGTFEPQWPYRVGQTPVAVAVADVNGDDRPDILTANNGAGTVSILLNNGNRTFGR